MSLEPHGGLGQTAGGEVRDGFYKITNLKPGRYRVHVSGEAVGIAGKTQEEVMKMPEKDLMALTKDPVPDGAIGNDQLVEVKGSEQTHDLKLESPKAKR